MPGSDSSVDWPQVPPEAFKIWPVIRIKVFIALPPTPVFPDFKLRFHEVMKDLRILASQARKFRDYLLKDRVSWILEVKTPRASTGK